MDSSRKLAEFRWEERGPPQRASVRRVTKGLIVNMQDSTSVEPKIRFAKLRLRCPTSMHMNLQQDLRVALLNFNSNARELLRGNCVV